MKYRTLVTLTLLVTYVLIIVGGATRVFEAGVSCPDWPHCYGVWWPWPESRVTALNGVGYVVDEVHYAWWQVFLEWSHRLLAGVVSLGVAGLLLGFVPGVFSSLRRHAIRAPLLALVGFFTIQIALGGVTVHLGNIHWSVALHLGTAMLVLGSLVWLRRAVAAADEPRQPLPVSRAVWASAAGFAVLVLVTMLVGAMVSSSHAGGVCGGLPACDGQWFPADWSQLWHMKHRYLAVITALVSVLPMVLLARAARQSPDDTTRQSLLHGKAVFRHVHLMVWGQVALGILTLYSFSGYPEHYPLLSIAHLAWGTLVWLAALGGVLTLAYGPTGRYHA